MAVQKTDCYKVVNIGYLKSLIGSNIQNNNGEVVNVNTTQPDTYCPTYSELTGGTLIPNWFQGSTPRSDMDGITVNSTAVLGGTYKNNQLVDRKDLGVKYTRFNTLSISRTDSGNISECGGNATLSKTYNYTRYTTSMNNSCVTSTTSSVVDGACNELTYHTLTGSVTNCTNYSIGKNGSISSTTRTDKISATTTFRGATKASGVVNITQNGLSGEYSVYDGRTYTGLTVSPIGTKGTQSNPIGCEGGVFGVTAIAYYKDKYHWKDSCGTEYTSKIKEESGQETLANTATTKMVVGDASLVCEGNSQFTYSSITGRATDKFDAINCCSGGENKNKTLSVTYQGQTASQTFYQVCADCSSSDKCKEPEIIATLTLNNGTTVNIEGSGELTSSMIESYKTTVTKAEIKDACTSIGNSAFRGFSVLTSVTISNSVTSIGVQAFANCTGLTSLTIPNSVTSIGNYAFATCTNLTSCTIGSGMRSIGDFAFYQCYNLTSIDIPNSVTSIGNYAFGNCTSLTSIDITDSVTSIGDFAFSYCTGLTNVTIGNSVTNIGGSVLTACTSLERITVERVVPPTIEENTFDSTNECPIYVPCESVNTYKNSWSRYASRITCEGGDETYTVYVTSEPNESSCARVLIADGGSIEFTLSIYAGGTTHTLKYLVSNRQEFGEDPKRFGTINVPIGQISSFRFNALLTDTGNILKANSSSNGEKLPQLTTQWSTLGSNTELWEGGIIPNLCTGDRNGNRFVVSWDINTVDKTITIYYMYQQIG